VTVIRRRLRIAVATCAAAAVIVPAAARADPYVVDHCTNPATGTGTVAFGDLSSGDSGVIGADCASGGAVHLRPIGSQFWFLNLSIPADRPNIQIERVVSSYSVPAVGGTRSEVFLFALLATLPTLAEDFVPIAARHDVVPPPGTRGLQWAVRCLADATHTCLPSQMLDILAVSSTRLTLNEGVAPTFTALGGTLLGGGDKGGQRTLVYDAHDTDSGVSTVTATMGSAVVGTAPSSCPFDDWSPCPRDLTSQTMTVDTTKVPDGSHELIVTVRDAANNVVTRSLGAIAVSNPIAAAGPIAAGGPGSGALGAIAGTPNGAGASHAAKLAARFATTKERTRRLRFTGQPTIVGTLADETGRPIAGATISVLARLRQAGAHPLEVATVRTGSDGGFSDKLAGGPSRTITFAYSAFTGDRSPAATSTLRTSVRALVTASIRPRSLPARTAITLSGRLGLLGRAGVDIRIQARDGRVWRTIDVVRTTSDGRFRWRYRFKPATAGRTFAFRARVASANYPFAPTNSQPISVRVR